MTRLSSFTSDPMPSDRTFGLMTRFTEISLVALAAVYFLSTIAPFRVLDPDLFHEMAAFRDCLQQGAVPTTDHFAYTPTLVPVVHHELGSGAIFYFLFNTLELSGLMLLRVVLTAAIVLFVALRARRAGANWATFGVLSFIGIGMTYAGFGTVRAQLFTFFFVSLEMFVLRPRTDSVPNGSAPSPYFLIPWLVWLNLHGGFVAGAGIYVALWVETVVREGRWNWRWFGIGLAMAMLVCVNPYGLEYPRYLLRAVTMARPGITEWRPIWSFDFSFQVRFYSSLIVLLYVLVRKGIVRMPGILVVLVTAAEAALHAKHLPLYAIVWTGVVPAWIEATPLSRVIERTVRRVPKIILPLAVAVTVLLMVNMAKKKPWQVMVPTSREAVLAGYPVVYPLDAVDWLAEQHFSGNVMTPFRAGAYVSWCLAPSVKVSLDGRYEAAYQPGVFEQVESFYRGESGWLDTLKRYPTQLVLARATDAVVPLLQREAGWRRVYDDGAFLLLAPAPAGQGQPRTGPGPAQPRRGP